MLGASVQNNIGLGRVNFNTGLNYLATVNDKVSHRLTIFNTQLSLTKNKDAYYDYFVNDDEIRREIFSDYFAFNPSLAQEFTAGQRTIDEVSRLITLDTQYVGTLDQQGADRFVALCRNIDQ